MEENNPLIRVHKFTKDDLLQLKDELNKRSLGEVIDELVLRYRKNKISN